MLDQEEVDFICFRNSVITVISTLLHKITCLERSAYVSLES